MYYLKRISEEVRRGAQKPDSSVPTCTALYESLAYIYIFRPLVNLHNHFEMIHLCSYKPFVITQLKGILAAL